MQVKTKLFSVLFAFALFFPCLFVLTACGGNNPELKDVEVTVNVADKVYDGTAIQATGTAKSGETATDQAIVFAYKLAGADDSTYTTTAPRNVGQYVVRAGVEETSQYKAAVSEPKAFAITAKEVGLNWAAPQSLVYDKQEKTPTVQATGLVQGDVCAVNAAVTAGKDNINVTAEGFTFTVSGLTNPNYKLPQTGLTSESYMITPYVIEDETLNFVYNGQTTFSRNVDLIGEWLTIELTFGSKNVGANVTGIALKLNGVATQNYEIQTEGVHACDANIVEKEIGLQWSTISYDDSEYDGTAKVPTVTATGLVQGDVCDVNAMLNEGDNINVTQQGFNFRATQALNANYKLPTNVVSPIYHIRKAPVNLYADFEYSGEPNFTKDLSSVQPGLTIDVWFDGSDVGEGMDFYVMKLNGTETNNYEVDECDVNIVQKEVELQWTAPANLKFNYTAKTPTVAATNLVGSDVVTVSSSLTAANNNVFPGSFTFTATGLTGAQAGNYKLPDIVESSSYEITADTLELSTPVENYQTNTGVDVWFAFTTTIEGRYEILTTGVSLTASDQFVYQRVGNNLQAISTNSATKNDVKYLSFEAAESTTYYFKVQDPSANNNNTITFRGHEHLYNDYNECIFCDYFKGVVLTPNVQSDEQTVQLNEKLFFKFPVKSGVYYYFTSTNFNNSNFTILYDDFELGQCDIGFGEANATFPDGDGFYYLKYEATDSAVYAGKITVHECTPDGYGFSTANGFSHYVGVTYYTTDYHNHIGDNITIPDLAIGEKMFIRFEVTKDANHKYGYTKGDNLSISEVKFYVKSSGVWQEEDLTYGTGNERTLDNTPDNESGRTYCYMVITSDGNSAGTIVINEVVTA